VILSVDPSLPLPVYEQVREQIVRMVSSGTLHPGTRLPTIRQLAADLGIAKGTVERAYELLAKEHVIERRGRNGTVVVDLPETPTNAARVELADAAERLVVLARQVGVDEAAVHDALCRAWQRI
jgi:DNA-binding transcriptional regulator YhcF (GntR family)